ncbi:MAG: GHKL domain-containing protein [Lachnospiraceae bacterium]|nr:GHKL domain-containing protein [Lachnospiraceae bacterium]
MFGEWLYWVCMETTKYFLLTFGILGYDLKKGKNNLIAGLYFVLGIILMCGFKVETDFYKVLWGFVFITFMFEGTLKKKFQCYIIEVLVITMGDLFMWSVYSLFHFNPSQGITTKEQIISETMALLFWGLFIVFSFKYRKIIRRYFEELTGINVFVIMMVLIGTAMIVTSNQFVLVYGANINVTKVSLMASVASTMLIIIGCVIYLYMSIVKRNAQMENALSQNSIILQKRYYEKMIGNYEGIRKFKHNMRFHVDALNVLCNENRFDEVKEYIANMHEEYVSNENINTGNSIVNYFVNGLIDDIKNKGELEYCVTGRFPENMRISNSDLCILFSNAFDNVKDALSKMDENRKFNVSIKNFENQLFVKIENSTVDKSGELLETDKEDKEMHGIGTKSMKEIIERYDGDIEWKVCNGMFIVEFDLAI